MLNVIPKPNKYTVAQGQFILLPTTKISGSAVAIGFLNMLLEPCFGKGLEQATEGEITFTADVAIAAESYLLKISAEAISVRYGDEAGAFYAVQTLRQLLKTDTSGRCERLCCPCVSIEDSPRFAYRGFMLDEARHFFGMDTVKQTLDMMALLKLNTFHWHLTDDQGWRVEIKSYPLLTEKGSIRNSTQTNLIGYLQHKEQRDKKEYGRGLYYTQAQIKEIVAYARALHINVVPEIDMPGHLIAAIACYPQLSCYEAQLDVSNRWGVMDSIGCAGKEELYKFVQTVIDELTELFPYDYFHIGGDEVPKTKWRTCPACQAKIKELSLADEEALQGHFNNRMLAYLKSKNKKMIGWNEILKASQLSDETVVQWWTGGFASTGVKAWAEKGNKVIMSHSPYLYMDHFYSMKDLKKSYAFGPERVGVDVASLGSILGIEAPLWTEYVRDKGKFDFNLYPRLAALAEICWTNTENKNFAEFDTRVQGFCEILTAKGIGFAPRKAYLCRGAKSLPRLIKCGVEWRRNPNSEYEKYRT